MKIAKDYFGHEINKGDVVLYNERASKGYRSSFIEGVVVRFNGLSTVSVVDHDHIERYKEHIKGIKTDDTNFCIDYHMDNKFPKNVVNLTALGIRERVIIE